VTAALRYEWVRITTVRSTFVLLALTLLLCGLLSWGLGAPIDDFDANGNVIPTDRIDWYAAFTAPLSLAAVFASVMAAQAIGQEYRFGIVRLTLTAFPQRLRVLTAKLVVVVGASMAFVAASCLGSEIALTLRGHPLPPSDASPPQSPLLLLAVVYVALWCLSAFAIAGVTRQTAIGVVVPIVSGLILEQIIAAVLRDRADWVVKVLPWSTANRWAQPAAEQSSFGNSFQPFELPIGAAALGIFALWVAAFLIVEIVTFVRRDA
jgi:ABC-2 type transport system permease protein